MVQHPPVDHPSPLADVLTAVPRQILRLGSLGLPRTEAREILDGSDWLPSEVAQNFEDIQRINDRLGGTRLTISGIERLLTDVDVHEEIKVLDIGTGMADIPRSLVDRARKLGRNIKVTATDSNPDILGLIHMMEYPEINLGRASAISLPYADGAYDFVISSLLLHHLSSQESLLALREMKRVARRAVIVNDLVRNLISFGITAALVNVISRNRLTVNDGPLSIRKSYTLSEMLDMMADVGLAPINIDHNALYRVAITSIPS